MPKHELDSGRVRNPAMSGANTVAIAFCVLVVLMTPFSAGDKSPFIDVYANSIQNLLDDKFTNGNSGMVSRAEQAHDVALQGDGAIRYRQTASCQLCSLSSNMRLARLGNINLAQDCR